MVTVRFAPSPTGRLHVGNARTALINWLFARRHGGMVILRFDDTDRERSKPEFYDAIREDLAWLEMTPDREERQSERLETYRAAFAQLMAAGRVYACYETEEELGYKRRRQLARGRPPIYDRAGLALTDADRARLEAEGRRPHWRFKLEPGEVAWLDLVRGPQQFRAETMSDPVLVRGDGSFLYMLPSTVDDMEMDTSHVIRGEDHVANTALQIQLFRALGAAPPMFAHVPLLVDSHGEGLSKRLGSMTLAEYRRDGIEALAISSLLARLGTGADLEPATSFADLAVEFDLSRSGRSTPRFDTDQLHHLNARLLQRLPFEAVADRLRDWGMVRADAAFWEAVRPNLSRLDDIRPWYDVCFSEIEPVIADVTVTAAAAGLLPEEPWDTRTWGVWTGRVKEETGLKAKALFRPLRLALTGSEHGPELKALLPLIGRQHAERRLRGERG